MTRLRRAFLAGLLSCGVAGTCAAKVPADPYEIEAWLNSRLGGCPETPPVPPPTEEDLTTLSARIKVLDDPTMILALGDKLIGLNLCCCLPTDPREMPVCYPCDAMVAYCEAAIRRTATRRTPSARIRAAEYILNVLRSDNRFHYCERDKLFGAAFPILVEASLALGHVVAMDELAKRWARPAAYQASLVDLDGTGANVLLVMGRARQSSNLCFPPSRGFAVRRGKLVQCEFASGSHLVGVVPDGAAGGRVATLSSESGWGRAFHRETTKLRLRGDAFEVKRCIIHRGDNDRKEGDCP